MCVDRLIGSFCVCVLCVCLADSTGTHSLYTRYQDYEIMFHVSTMLPYTANNTQQVRLHDYSTFNLSVAFPSSFSSGFYFERFNLKSSVC